MTLRYFNDSSVAVNVMQHAIETNSYSHCEPFSITRAIRVNIQSMDGEASLRGDLCCAWLRATQYEIENYTIRRIVKTR